MALAHEIYRYAGFTAKRIFSVGPSVNHHAAQPSIGADPRKRACGAHAGPLNFELIIVNDGSTDDTEKIIRSFSDSRIVLINQDNQGISSALNNGLAVAKAVYIARFDADDVCYPNRLEKQYDFLAGNPQYCIVGCDADYYDMNDNYVFTCHSPGYTNEEIQRIKMDTCPFIHSGVMYKKQDILDAGGYTIHAHSFEDHFLWTKVLKESKAC